jgi:orotidine-5'-phosphate decarboxylase
VEAARLGVSIFNIHAGGGTEMMRRTVQAVATVAASEGLTPPKIIAVTLLTSMDAEVLKQISVANTPERQVVALAQLAAASGLDGVVASPLEVPAIRSAVSMSKFLIVTPGVRPTGVTAGDQKRLMTPAGSISAGSDYLVVGRPIIEAADPVVAARKVLDEMAEAERSLQRPEIK